MHVNSSTSEPPGRRDFIKSIENQRDGGVRWQSTMAGYGNKGQGPGNEECRQSHDEGKGKEMESPRKSPESKSPILA